MELADPALGRPRGLAGMEERLGRPLEHRLDPERRVDLLDRPLRLRKAAVDDSCDVPRLPAPLGIDVRDLEQSHALDVDGAVRPGRFDEAGHERLAQRAELRGDRLREDDRARGDERRH